MSLKKENQPESILKPSDIDRAKADWFKSSAISEAKKFDEKFDITNLTGFADGEKDLWQAYFAMYWAAEAFHSQEISEGFLDAVMKFPIIGKLWGSVRSSEDAGKLAWLELKERAEKKVIKYRRELHGESAIDKSSLIQYSAHSLSITFLKNHKQPIESLLKELKIVADRYRQN
ncbi:MAG: hypothetical protein COU63_02285 [Candidatus Pacebacteria bacterium CG10_big_fil_rev_8_21_14_0_10_36_11]|nr:hypothetical protein [Candidatus Pacearchaeota archaeon]OIP73598.1 MAG: hypothetical protein AUK08_03430 [Candidatus Pacebacteria bacterium CG2_30_36_39]PIR64821.1 MAG: hypothetical protein COU63_02285 [Candidatus Pacebacteria bacterium CG10_big_fil_rev_8_21_14_0_10_36_11]PJC42587.1 MAG: hypothetical protein CO040_03650 [Candidatus Pacebacteria bacterium CG_4_9_14_0_2_um_filter_36_8]